MKHILLLLLITSAFAARANDTLTRAQIYNFNVGDTFDYEENVNQRADCPTPCVTTLQLNNYFRCIIQKIYYSVNYDTLFVVRNWVYPLPAKSDTLILDSLQFEEIIYDTTNGVSSHMEQLFVDTNSKYNHRVLNVASFNGGFFGFSNGYVEGLGKVFSYYGGGENGPASDSIYLIYYAKAPETWGTPYYVANQSNLVHFMPIPEECATWISQATPPCGSYNEIVRTGSRISANGHTYVELIYSAYNFQDSLIATDSLIGYFRNDTLNQKVYLYNGINLNPFYTYDYSVAADSGILSLSLITVGGLQRTKWNGIEGISYLLGEPVSYIEGIGSVAGILPFSCYYQPNLYPELTAYSTLTCFSVCGQTLYPYDSTANCSLAAINNVAPITEQIKVYPTINNGSFNVEVLDQSLQGAQLLITDITGRQIERRALNSQLNNINIQQYASGMYIWQVLSDEKLLQAGKLIKE